MLQGQRLAFSFNFLKKREKVQINHFERFRVRGLVISRESVSTLNIHSILWEPLNFIHFLAYNLLAFKEKKIELNGELKRKRKRKLILLDLEGQVICPRTREGSKPRSSG